jgi:hypothetical protein
MPATADGGKNPDLRSSSDRVLHIAYVCATRDKARSAGEHAIPDDTRLFVAAILGTHQVAFKSPVEQRAKRLAGFDHFGCSLSLATYE